MKKTPCSIVRLVMDFFQIELEQILGLNQDLAPTSYENANTIPNNNSNSKLKVREKGTRITIANIGEGFPKWFITNSEQPVVKSCENGEVY